MQKPLMWSFNTAHDHGFVKKEIQQNHYTMYIDMHLENDTTLFGMLFKKYTQLLIIN